VGTLGPTEIIAIIVVLVLLFGAKKLPELGSSIGKSITNFKAGMKEAQEVEEETPTTSTTTTSAAADGATKAPRDSA
jgi:sec-independent protein translocase protein TatA